MDAQRLTERGKAIYRRRKETVERSFADGKQLHGHRYAHMCGLGMVSGQGVLSAACQNMKKIAQAVFLRLILCLLTRMEGRKTALTAYSVEFCRIFRHVRRNPIAI